MESMTGQLLVATPTLKDPNFDRTVVLLVAHETGGALGVVLNRATEVPVAEVLGDWGELAGDPAVLFEGGPVQPESAICLARTRPEVKKRVSGFHQVAGALGTVDLSADPDRLRDSVSGIRVFAGYSGWSPGQLEDEISSGRLRRAARRPVRQPPGRPLGDGPAPPGRHPGRGGALPARPVAELSTSRHRAPCDAGAGWVCTIP